MILLTDGEVYAPEPLGRADLLVAGGRVVALAPHLDPPPRSWEVEVHDLRGARVVPGLVDGHVHVTGGGGEAGPATRVAPLAAAALAGAGVTTVVGVLGTDGTTRTMRDLLAQTYALREQGLSAFCMTGGYEVPPPTLTGNVRDDIVFLEPVVAIGEVAVSDHRSSQPTVAELARLAAHAHVAGLISGKAGLLHLHMGDGARGLAPVRTILDETELPARTFHPTHVNRNPRLFAEAQELMARGVTVDVTADDDAAGALLALAAAGLPWERVTVSSDAGGSIPTFDADGRMVSMEVGSAATLLATLAALVRRGLPLERALRPFTANPARLFRFARKGRIAAGADADLLVLEPAGGVRAVMARGRFLVRDGGAR
ncbi:MAG TPA: beta-aspartyl-peptidase [Polyangia bacterium]|jgi:beta-aspartyl-dipeptidase (metallo-type)